MNTVHWVGQEHPLGCGAACCAMITGRPYATVVAAFPDLDLAVDGGIFTDWEDYLVESGYAIARRRWRKLRGSGLTSPWPPEPFTELHLCQVIPYENDTAHCVVLLADGVVLDPACPRPCRLSDYRHVYLVAGIVPIDS